MKKVFVLMAMAALVLVSCEKDNKGGKNHNNGGDDEEYVAPIKIDGDVADWAKLDATKVAVAKNLHTEWTAVKEIRCYADEFYAFYYIEFDAAQAKELVASANGQKENSEGQMEDIELPIRVNLNTDGEFASGYLNYSLDGYDFILEGGIAKGGQWQTFNPNMYQRIDGWVNLSTSEEGGICEGAGKDNHYELAISLSAFNAKASGSTVPMPIGKTFQTGIRFYTADWGELSNMPNTAPNPDSEVKGEQKGWGHLMNVTVVE